MSASAERRDRSEDMLVKRRNDIMSAVAELVQMLEQPPSDSSLRHMLGAQHAGITVAGRDGSVQCVSATDRYPVLLDEIQQRHQEGPCLTAAWQHHVVRIDDIGQERQA